MKICVICKRLYTNRDLIADRFGRLFHFPAQLALLGHDVTVLALDYDRSRAYEEQTIDNVHFRSIPVIGALRTPAGLFSVTRQAIELEPDVTLCSGDIYLGAIAEIVARTRNIPFVFDIYDDYRYFKSAKLPGMSMLLRRAIRRANTVIVASEPLKRIFAPLNQDIHVVENGTDITRFRPLDKADCRQQLRIPFGAPVVGYFGSIEERRGIHTLLTAIELCRSKHPDIRLLIAGSNDAKVDFDRLPVDYRGLVPQNQIPVMINACDVVTIPYHRDPYIDATNACKIAEYLATGVPVAVSRVSDMETIFRATPDVLAEPGDPSSLSRVLMRQLADPVQTAFDASLTWEALAQKLDEILRALVTPNVQPAA
jgi:glycosyltransferase involved in cell wall biosynthesis